MKITIIIPCYNESERLPAADFRRFMDAHPEISFVMANDGSRDNTLEVLNDIAKDYPQMEVFDGGENRGKAHIVQAAMRHVLDNTDSDYVGFFDADLATPLEEILKFKTVLEEKGNLLLICGSRIQRLGSNIRRKWLRHYFGRTFATAVSNILCLPVYDTQCGAKILSREAAAAAIQEPFISKWFFDVEIFARIITGIGYKECVDRCFEYPLDTWIEKGDTRLTTKDFLRTPVELLRLNKKYHKAVKKQYENCIFAV
ncbi:MAG: glycosyltransferase [Bacteroidales bacterium]|nr:glycosyltransferase [Bacteroidales bacterium]